MSKQSKKAKKEIVKFLNELSESADGVDIPEDNAYTDATLQFLLLFNVVEVDEDRNSIKAKASTDTANYFIKSLSVYIKEDLSLIGDWNYLGDKQREKHQNLLHWGLQFLTAMEKRRVEQLRSEKVLSFGHIVLLVIKAKFDDGIDRYLTEFNLKTHRYQLIGGYMKNEDKNAEAAVKRRVHEDLLMTNFDYDKQVKIDKVKVKISSTRVSRQKGVNTHYDVDLYHITIDQPKLSMSGKERWATIDELIDERTSHGVSLITPFADTDDTEQLIQTFQELPYTFKRTQTLPEYQKTEEKKEKNKITTVQTLLEDEENENLEFKSSARWDYKEDKMNKELRGPIIKAISGFMNSAGGYLLIGVDDNREILGIAKDLSTMNKKNEDGYQLFLMREISNLLGKEFATFVEISFESFEGKVVCVVKVKRSTQPVFFKAGKGRDFYVRAGNSTRGLNTEEAYRYIKFNWD